jgi:hypothetical protein
MILLTWLFYPISNYITYAFEVECLELALLYPESCYLHKTLGAHHSFSMKPIDSILKAAIQHKSSISESPVTSLCGSRVRHTTPW